MSLSQAYGGQPDITILSYADYRKDLESMGHNDKKVFDLTIKVDDDLTLSDLIATIKNLPVVENGTGNIVVSK